MHTTIQTYMHSHTLSHRHTTHTHSHVYTYQIHTRTCTHSHVDAPCMYTYTHACAPALPRFSGATNMSFLLLLPERFCINKHILFACEGHFPVAAIQPARSLESGLESLHVAAPSVPVSSWRQLVLPPLVVTHMRQAREHLEDRFLLGRRVVCV